MRYSACGADVFATSTENYASVRVYYGCFFPVFLFGCEGFHVAEVDTFAACGAFLVIDFGVPGDFVSGDAFVCFFCQGCCLPVESTTPCKYLNIAMDVVEA